MQRIGRKATERRSTAVVVLLALSLALVMAASEVAFAAEHGFRVVVHPQNHQAVFDRDLLTDAFLKKRMRWPDGEAMQPVDQRFEAPARARFSEAVLRRSVFAIRSYWQQRIFTGRGVPPPELGTDEAVIRYVQSHRGAVGYVSDHADTTGVRVLTPKP
jgi:hypothetical protein